MADKLPPGWVTAVRILEYTGPKAWVEGSLKRSTVPVQGTADFDGAGFIKSGMVIWEGGDTGEQKRDLPIVVGAPPGAGN